MAFESGHCLIMSCHCPAQRCVQLSYPVQYGTDKIYRTYCTTSGLIKSIIQVSYKAGKVCICTKSYHTFWYNLPANVKSMNLMYMTSIKQSECYLGKINSKHKEFHTFHLSIKQKLSQPWTTTTEGKCQNETFLFSKN